MPYGYDFTEIELTTLVTGKPVKAMQGLAMYQNAIAIAEGAPGAPRVVRGGLSTFTNSVSGSLAAGAAVNISIGTTSFFPNLSSSTGSDIALVAASGLSTDPDFGRMRLIYSGAGTADYAVSWRSIGAT